MSRRAGPPGLPPLPKFPRFKAPRGIKLAGKNNGSHSEIRDQERADGADSMTDAERRAMFARLQADRPKDVKSRGTKRSSR
jgi:hypothetical protein